MIGARVSGELEAILAQMAEQAAAVAEARVREAALSLAQDPARWRDASLVWPAFAGGRKG